MQIYHVEAWVGVGVGGDFVRALSSVEPRLGSDLLQQEPQTV